MSLGCLLTKSESQTMMTRGIREKEDRFGGVEVSIKQVGTQYGLNCFKFELMFGQPVDDNSLSTQFS